MKTKFFKSLIAVSLFTALSSTVTYADDDTGYFAAVAVNRVSADFEDVDDLDFDDNDDTLSFRGGYMFTDIFGIEVQYLDLGNYQSEGNSPTNRINIDADALSLAGVLNWGVTEHVDLYGKLGAYYIDANSDSFVAGRVLQDNASTTEVFGAGGAEYDFGKFNLFVEISVAETDISDLAIDIASIGVKYEFGQ